MAMYALRGGEDAKRRLDLIAGVLRPSTLALLERVGIHAGDRCLGTDDDRPSLFGAPFDGPMEGHEPGQPVHYDLHAWVWRHNPAGELAQFNPEVSCPPAG